MRLCCLRFFFVDFVNPPLYGPNQTSEVFRNFGSLQLKMRTPLRGQRGWWSFQASESKIDVLTYNLLILHWTIK